MPCHDDYPIGNSVSEDEYERVKADLSVMKKRCDAATRVACELEKHFTPHERSELSKETQDWLSAHYKADAKRKKAEADKKRRDQEEKDRKEKLQKDRKAALNKLTPEERRVLGLPTLV